MVCDSSWQYPYAPASPLSNWKGYHWKGVGDPTLYDEMVEAPAASLLISETPRSKSGTYGGSATFDRICPPSSLDMNHYTSTASWGANHDDISQWDSDKRHNGGLNYIFFDGHVKWMKSEQTVSPKNLWTLTQKD
jgi:prepilin-type processing-associated H-X9-DG protein